MSATPPRYHCHPVVFLEIGHFTLNIKRPWVDSLPSPPPPQTPGPVRSAVVREANPVNSSNYFLDKELRLRDIRPRSISWEWDRVQLIPELEPVMSTRLNASSNAFKS